MELTTEKITLPSGAEITIREMTATEEGYLASPKLMKSGEAFDRILHNCIVDKNVDLDSMLVGDRYFLMLAIRRLTFGDDYDFKVRCGTCGHSFNVAINLADMPVKKLEGATSDTYTITLPRSGKLVVFRVLRGRDEKRISSVLRKSPQDIVRLSLFLHSVSIDGDTSFTEDFFRTLPGADSQYYRRKIDEVSPGIDTTVAVTCPDCDDEFEVELPINEGFFFPNTRNTMC